MSVTVITLEYMESLELHPFEKFEYKRLISESLPFEVSGTFEINFASSVSSSHGMFACKYTSSALSRSPIQVLT